MRVRSNSICKESKNYLKENKWYPVLSEVYPNICGVIKSEKGMDILIVYSSCQHLMGRSWEVDYE